MIKEVSKQKCFSLSQIRIETKNLVTFMGWGLRIKDFNIMGIHWKIQFLRRINEKKQ